MKTLIALLLFSGLSGCTTETIETEPLAREESARAALTLDRDEANFIPPDATCIYGCHGDWDECNRNCKGDSDEQFCACLCANEHLTCLYGCPPRSPFPPNFRICVKKEFWGGGGGGDPTPPRNPLQPKD